MSQTGTAILVSCATALANTDVQQDPAPTPPIAHFAYDGTDVEGLDGTALRVTSAVACEGDLRVDPATGFSVQFWVRTTVDASRRMVLLAQKDAVAKNDLHAHKRPGWMFYASDGTWAWNIGSDKRRLTYERDNGRIMPLNDGRWHQLTMTFDRAKGQVRLFFDGVDRVLYNLRDSDGFEFANRNPLTVGGNAPRQTATSGPTVDAGRETLQRFVDAYRDLGLPPLEPDDLRPLVVSPQRFISRRSEQAPDLTAIRRLESELMRSPYTVHQSDAFMDVAPMFQLYELRDGTIKVRERAALTFAQRERIDAPEFDIDELSVWNRPLSRDEVRESYRKHFPMASRALPHSIDTLTAAIWNIEHGGKHFTVDEHGWDSRRAIAEIIRREGVDLVMMQETYSSGDFIAAEMGYYFAESVDWDYLNQGANLSVISRFPIDEVYVPPDATFSNIAVKVSLSQTQDMYVMSNWYGMNKFAQVFDYHEPRFEESDRTPTLFGGDFNAVPHTDGGDSPASKKLLGAGFTDAYRSLFPDAKGASHRSDRRIDQLYYRGAALTNTATKIVSTWPPGFPADHYMIVASFELDEKRD